MNIHEYQAKALLAKFAVPLLKGGVAYTKDEAMDVARKLGTPVTVVKAQVKMPVTYAAVWEFWLRHPDVAGAVDFITIHILPYWEDFPIPAAQAAAHVGAIREKGARALPGKEIVIGEVGWPTATSFLPS